LSHLHPPSAAFACACRFAGTVIPTAAAALAAAELFRKSLLESDIFSPYEINSLTLNCNYKKDING
jgi:hypothetical protein